MNLAILLNTKTAMWDTAENLKGDRLHSYKKVGLDLPLLITSFKNKIKTLPFCFY